VESGCGRLWRPVLWAWPDADAVVALIEAEFADDTVYYDPSNGEFGIEGKEANIQGCRQFFAAYPDLHPQVTGMYLSTTRPCTASLRTGR